MLPFAPDDEGAVGGENDEERAGEFMEKLAGDAPPTRSVTRIERQSAGRRLAGMGQF